MQKEAFHLPLVQDLIKREAKFDVALFSMISNDIGIYLAKEVFDAPLVFYFFGRLMWHLFVSFSTRASRSMSLKVVVVVVVVVIYSKYVLICIYEHTSTLQYIWRI